MTCLSRCLALRCLLLRDRCLYVQRFRQQAYRLLHTSELCRLIVCVVTKRWHASQRLLRHHLGLVPRQRLIVRRVVMLTCRWGNHSVVHPRRPLVFGLTSHLTCRRATSPMSGLDVTGLLNRLVDRQHNDLQRTEQREQSARAEAYQREKEAKAEAYINANKQQKLKLISVSKQQELRQRLKHFSERNKYEVRSNMKPEELSYSVRKS